MQMMVKLRAARCLAWLLASAIMVPSLVSGAMAEKLSVPSAPTVLVFPLDSPDEKAASQIAADLNGFIREGLVAKGTYRVVEYTDRLPAVKRLVAMQPEKKDKIAGPFSSDSAAISNAVDIGASMSADLLVIGSIDKYSFTEDGKAEVAATVQVIDGKTGKPVRTIAVTGQASKPVGTEVTSEASLAALAMKDVGRKIVSDITGQDYNETSTQMAAITQKGTKKKSALPWILLFLGVGLVVGNGGGGSASAGSGGTDLPPDSPF